MAENHPISGRTNPKAALKRLEELAGQAGINLFERARLSSELIENLNFIQARYGGDEARAVKDLQEQYFKDIGGLMSLFRIRDLYRTFPDEAVWREEKYDLRALWDKWNETTTAQRQPAASRHTATVKELKDRDQKITDLEYRLKREQDGAEDKDKIIANLRADNERLKLRVAELEGRLDECQKRKAG